MKTRTVTILVKKRDHIEVILNCLTLGVFVGMLHLLVITITATIISPSMVMSDPPPSLLGIILTATLLTSIMISILSLIVAYSSDISIKEIRKTIKVIE